MYQCKDDTAFTVSQVSVTYLCFSHGFINTQHVSNRKTNKRKPANANETIQGHTYCSKSRSAFAIEYICCFLSMVLLQFTHALYTGHISWVVKGENSQEKVSDNVLTLSDMVSMQILSHVSHLPQLSLAQGDQFSESELATKACTQNTKEYKAENTVFRLGMDSRETVPNETETKQ